MNDRSVENSRIHGSPHHSKREQCVNSTVGFSAFWITEILLEGWPIYSVAGSEETKVREESMLPLVKLVTLE